MAVGLYPTEELLKLCILVAFADIHASNSPKYIRNQKTCATGNQRLDSFCEKYPDQVAEVYSTGNAPPWQRYAMTKRADAIRETLLELFHLLSAISSD